MGREGGNGASHELPINYRSGTDIINWSNQNTVVNRIQAGAQHKGKVTEGRKYEEVFVGGITEVHSSKILGVAIGDNYAAIESSMDVTHKDWGRMARSQVAVQRWENGKIVKEKFYYNTK